MMRQPSGFVVERISVRVPTSENFLNPLISGESILRYLQAAISPRTPTISNSVVLRIPIFAVNGSCLFCLIDS